MWETAWSLLEQLTSSPLKRALLESCFMLRHGFSFHLDNLRILWIKIYHAVLWSKSHFYFFLTQSLVQNKSIFSFALIFETANIWQGQPWETFVSSLQCLCCVTCWEFRECPVGCGVSPASASPGSEQLHPADEIRDTCTATHGSSNGERLHRCDWRQRKWEWQTPGQLPRGVMLICACLPGPAQPNLDS